MQLSKMRRPCGLPGDADGGLIRYNNAAMRHVNPI